MLLKGITVEASGVEGKGLIAHVFIPQGTIVWKLDPSERILTLEELNKLPQERRKLAYQYKDGYIIVTDSSEYMNHSCDPNTWWSDDETLVARRDIQPGEEVTYDYATAETNSDFRSDWECHCGAKNCRKVITGNDCLDPEFQKMYKGHLPSWVEAYVRSKIDPLQ